MIPTQKPDEKPYKSSANLTMEEMDKLAEEIRSVMLKGQGVTMEQFKRIAKRINPKTLGHRRFRALKYEPKIESYFPSEVYEILKERADRQQYSRFNNDDIEFMRSHGGMGIRWVADHLYSNTRDISVKMKKFHVLYKEKHHTYSQEEKDFVRANIDKGLKWLSMRTNQEVNTLRKLAIRMGIEKSRIRVAGNTNETYKKTA